MLIFQGFGTERHGKGRDPDESVRGFCQVRLREMKEMRLNHRRGVVTNHVDAQNLRGSDPKRQVMKMQTCELS